MLHRYDPIREPRKEISHESMVETLKRKVREAVEKHAQVNGGSGEPLGATGRAEPSHDLAQPKPSPTLAISWLKPVRTGNSGIGYQRSACGRFAVAKVLCGGVFKYTASRCYTDLPGEPLGSFDAAEKARACCERYAAARCEK